jgi:hypothetical protein
MTDYTEITEAETNAGAPSKSSLWKRWAKNWIAGFEGAVGAPRLQGKAVAYVGNGCPIMQLYPSDAVILDDGIFQNAGTLSTTSATIVAAYQITSQVYQGTFRLRASHKTDTPTGGSQSVLELYKNGVKIAEFGTYSTTGATEVIDVTVAQGDTFLWYHRRTVSGTSTVWGFYAFANNGYIPAIPLRAKY